MSMRDYLNRSYRLVTWLVWVTVFCFVSHTTQLAAQTVHNPTNAEYVWKGRAIDNPIYDLSIKKWNSIYNPGVPWYWFKAQLLAESGLNPNAVSPVGAKGLGQFMPNTWKDMQSQLGFNGSEYVPSLSIQAQAYYMSQLRAQFKRDRPEWDRQSLAYAAYNAGLGNVLKAQKRGGNSLLYKPMIEALPTVTGPENSRETTMYVNRIWRYTDHYHKLYSGE